MKWMVPFNQLDAVQSAAVDDIDSSLDSAFAGRGQRMERQQQVYWVKGFAGSGKTIVLTHVAERLAAKQQRRKIGFATYTHALKDLVQSGLSEQALSYRFALATRSPRNGLRQDAVADGALAHCL